MSVTVNEVAPGREVEQAVAGMMLNGVEVADEAVSVLNEQDFQYGEEKLIFRACADLIAHGQIVDPITVTEWARTRAKKNLADYVTALVNGAPEPESAGDYFTIMKSRSMDRKLRGFSAAVEAVVGAAGTPEEKLSKLLADLEGISETRSMADLQTIQEVFHDTMGEIGRRVAGDVAGTMTGFADLDEMTGGLQDGDLVIVAGRPSMGKTAFSMNIAENVALDSGRVLVFSMEMPGTQLAQRIISGQGEVNLHSMRSGALSDEDLGRIEGVIDSFGPDSILMDATAGLTVLELRNRARKARRKHGRISLIVIDYIQLMSGEGRGGNRTEEVSNISRGLKALAKEMECPVVALSQLNRSLESRADKRPMNSDLRESGAIEQDADVILFVYRDEVYNPQSRFKGMAEIIIGKQRNGPIGIVEMDFDKKYSRFRTRKGKASPFTGSTAGADDQVAANDAGLMPEY